MSQDEKYRDIIKREMSKLKRSVKLKVFTSQSARPDGTKIRACMDCNQFMALLRIYEENSNGLLTVEELSYIINSDELFQIKIGGWRIGNSGLRSQIVSDGYQ